MDDETIQHIDNALTFIIAVSLIILSIMVGLGKCQHHHYHKWNNIYEDNSIRVERCECGQERYITK